MKPTPNQWTVLGLLIILVGLSAARSQSVRNLFSNAVHGASNQLGNTAHGQANAPATAQAALDWHLVLYWGAAGLLVLALADVAPGVIAFLLLLIIFGELLTHWTTYAALIQIPTK